MSARTNLSAFLAGADFGTCLDCGGLMVPDAYTDSPACVVCSGNPDLVPVVHPEHEGEKGWHLGERMPPTDAERAQARAEYAAWLRSGDLMAGVEPLEVR